MLIHVGHQIDFLHTFLSRVTSPLGGALGMPVTRNLQLTREFRKIELGDKRLEKRCLKVVKDLSQHPDESIPKSCGEWSATKAAYRFFDNDQVTHEALLLPHIQETVSRSQGRPTVLAIQDTTFLNYTDHPNTEDLGPIGTHEGLQGLIVHNTLAVDGDTGEILGLLHQQAWVREGRYPQRETTAERRQRPRESECWVRGILQAEEVGLMAPLHMMDREGDIYEVLREVENKRFVIRACKNRPLAEQGQPLFETLRHSPLLGTLTVDVPRRPGQRQRTALLVLRARSVQVRPPRALGRHRDNVSVNAVEVHELHPPKGTSPLQWVLLTSEPIDTAESCVKVANLYRSRWKIEEFHKSLKTGCQMEKRQLKTRQRLEAALGLYSVIGIMLLRVREAARDLTRKATDYFNEVQLKLLHRRYPKIGNNPSARAAFRAVAQLGGFLARTGDGEPGWKTLWLGMRDLMVMEHGHYSISSKVSSPVP
jgi:hypothetical protein